MNIAHLLPFRILRPLSKLAVVFWSTLFTPLANAQPDDSLEYFVTHARALIRDVRENFVSRGTPDSLKMPQFEQKMEKASLILSSLKDESISQTCPEDVQRGQPLVLSSLQLNSLVSSGRDCYVTPIQGPDANIWGLNMLFPEERIGRYGDTDPYATSTELYLPFQNPFTLPSTSQPITEMGNAQFLNAVLKLHCAGLDEEDVVRLLPESLPFDQNVARSISRLFYITGELAPFMKRGLQENHPYIEFFQLVFPYLIPEYNDVRDRDLNNDSPSDWCTFTHQTCTRWIQDGEGGTRQMNYGWCDFYEWCEWRLDRDVTESEDCEIKQQLREKLKHLMRRGPFTRLFDNSAGEEESSDSDEMS